MGELGSGLGSEGNTSRRLAMIFCCVGEASRPISKWKGKDKPGRLRSMSLPSGLLLELRGIRSW